MIPLLWRVILSPSLKKIDLEPKKVVKSEKVGQKFTEARSKLNLSLEDIQLGIFNYSWFRSWM